MSDEKEIMKVERFDNLMPVSLRDKFFLAEQLVKSGIIPNSINTPQKAMAILQMGHELGLSPMVALNNISVVNGRATLGADLIVAIIMKHPDYSGMEIKGDDKQCTVLIRRRAGEKIDTFTGSFSMDDAARAGLVSKDSWKKYPQRMLKHRAISYAARDAFPDALSGIYMPEEMETIEAPEHIETPIEAPVEIPKGIFSQAEQAIKLVINEKALCGIEKMLTLRSWTPDEEKLLAIRIDEKRRALAAKIIE